MSVAVKDLRGKREGEIFLVNIQAFSILLDVNAVICFKYVTIKI
jgi:hypothetical protein